MPQAHPTKDLANFIKKVIEFRSREEEEQFISKSIQNLLKDIKSKAPSNEKIVEICIKTIYYEILGHDTAMEGFIATLVESKNSYIKKVAYLCCSLILERQPELKLLIIATLIKDLKSKNEIDIASALITFSKLCDSSSALIFLSDIQSLLKHISPYIRKFAYSSLQKVYALNEELLPNYSELLKKGLSDKDYSVKLMVISSIVTEIHKNTSADMLEISCVIEGTIIENLQEYYEYQKISAPFFQIYLIRLICHIAEKNSVLHESLIEILEKILYKIRYLKTEAAYFIFYELLEGVFRLPHSSKLKELAVHHLLITIPETHNPYTVYLFLKSFDTIATLSPDLLQDHEKFIIERIGSNDESIITITLSLVNKIANSGNFEYIYNKILEVSNNSHLNIFADEIFTAAFNIIVKFSFSSLWFIEKFVKLLACFKNIVYVSNLNNILSIICEYAEAEPEVLFKFITQLLQLDQSGFLKSWLINKLFAFSSLRLFLSKKAPTKELILVLETFLENLSQRKIKSEDLRQDFTLATTLLKLSSNLITLKKFDIFLPGFLEDFSDEEKLMALQLKLNYKLNKESKKGDSYEERIRPFAIYQQKISSSAHNPKLSALYNNNECIISHLNERLRLTSTFKDGMTKETHLQTPIINKDVSHNRLIDSYSFNDNSTSIFKGMKKKERTDPFNARKLLSNFEEINTNSIKEASLF